MNFTDRIVSGVFWSYGLFVGGKILTLTSLVVLARLLTPEDFGTYVFAVIVFGFIELFRNLGFRDALIYASDKISEGADTAFVICIIIGIVQFALVFGLAPYATLILDDPRTVDIFHGLSITLLLNASIQVQIALLFKKLEYRRLAVVDFGVALFKAIVTIVMAFNGAGIWSLVVGQVAGTAFRVAVLWFIVDWRPGRSGSIARAREMWRYGKHLVSQKLIAAITGRMDQLVIGSIIGEAALGIYFIAARLPQIITQGSTEVLTRVLFPAFASINQDRDQLVKAFIASTKYTALLTWPAGIGLLVIAPTLIPFLFGGQWTNAILLAQILAIMGLLVTLPWAAGDVFKAIGRPEIITKLVVAENAVSIPAIIWMAYTTKDSVSVVVTMVAITSIGVLVRLAVATKVMNLHAGAYLAVFRTPLLSTITMAVCALGAGWLVEVTSPTVHLLAMVLAGITGFAGGVFVVDPPAINDIRVVLKSLRKGA